MGDKKSPQKGLIANTAPQQPPSQTPQSTPAPKEPKPTKK